MSDESGSSQQPGDGDGDGIRPEVFTDMFERLRDSVPESARADGRGALAAITRENVRAALAIPQSGEQVSLAHPLNTTVGPDNSKPALHYMVELGDGEPPEPTGHKDFIGIDYHGKATTHLDALCHIAYRGELFGGIPAREAYSSRGSTWAAVTTMSQGLVLRGVLLDMPVVRGVQWLEPGIGVHGTDIAAAESRLGISVGAGDAVLLRSGHGARRAALGAWNSDNASAGLHVDAMPLLAERGIALLGGDGDSDMRPSPVAGVHSPIHALALTALGIALLDNLDLEPLAVACARAQRYEFLLLVAPLVITRGTGSPVNPIAVL